MQKTTFQVNPLDLNIAKIQFNLIQKSENITSNSESSISENYQHNGPTLNLFELQVTLNTFTDNNANLIVDAVDKQKKSKNIVLMQGKKEDVFKYLKSTKFFENCKTFIKENFYN